MRLSTKLSLITAAGIALVLSTYCAVRVRREVALFESDMRHDHAALGHALAASAQEVARRNGPAAAVEILRQAGHGRASIRWTTGPATETDDEPTSAVVQSGGQRFLLTRVPISLGGSRGVIEIRESLAEQRRYVTTTIIAGVTVTVVAIGMSTLLIMGTSWLLVGKPLAEVMRVTRRIGAGDLSGRLDERTSGEMGELARELNAMSERLSSARHRLDRETRARFAALEQLRHAERLTTVGQLAAGVAHELGTPLNVVAARARMIERGESLGEEVLADARAIREQSDRMIGIIRQLLGFARRERPGRSRADVSALAARTIRLLEPLARKSGVVLEGPEPDDPVEAEVDGGQLEQVVTNLVMNAIQAQPSGGTVRVEVDRRGEVGTGAGELVLAVSDEGVGIPEEIEPRIFEPFFTTKKAGQGTGLGLSVVYGIVHEHGGRVEVQSRPGAGSRFVVTLPARAPGPCPERDAPGCAVSRPDSPRRDA